MDFDMTFGKAGRRRQEDEPMRLLLLGDFSGAAAPERAPLAARPTHQVDVDSFETILKRLRPRASTAHGVIEFSHLDDFHPDQLAARLPRFRELAARRAAAPVEHEDLLGRLLGKAPEGGAPPAPRPAGLEGLIHDAIAPHIVKNTSAETQSHVAAVNAALTEEMRALLHDGSFQSMEATWRGLYWVISNLELDDDLQVHIFDVSRDELLADVVASRGQLAQTGLYRALADRWRNVPGAHRWAALCALMDFGSSDTDIGLLAALGLIASQAGGPLFGAAAWSLAFAEEAALAGWQQLRQSEAAPWIALAAPRVLLRVPYGKRSDPIEAFPFEEIEGAPDADALLWAPGSLALALLVGRAFSARGWEMEPGDERELGDLPAYTFEAEGEKRLQPGGEHALTERHIQQLLERGIVPIASRVDRNAVVAVRFQSVADPPAAIQW
jgi:type VI secretion system ImpC/EvpB family protein